jgi:hypothetical protein
LCRFDEQRRWGGSGYLLDDSCAAGFKSAEYQDEDVHIGGDLARRGGVSVPVLPADRARHGHGLPGQSGPWNLSIKVIPL